MPHCRRVKTSRYVIPRLIQNGNMDGIWYIYVIYVYFFNRSQNKWFCLDSTTHSNPTGRASAVVSPLGSAGLRSPSKSASLQTASHKKCNFAQDRIPPPPIKYVPGSGAVIARVYIMYEALGLRWGCNVLKACGGMGWMCVGCSCR